MRSVASLIFVWTGFSSQSVTCTCLYSGSASHQPACAGTSACFSRNNTIGGIGVIVANYKCLVPDSPFPPGSVLVSGDAESNVQVRIATTEDEGTIAALRLSSFSNFSESQQENFCSPCRGSAGRRLQGMTCVVAIPTNSSHPMSGSSVEIDLKDFFGMFIIRSRFRGSTFIVATTRLTPTDLFETVVGSVEISFHEFGGTSLGRRRPPPAVLYISQLSVCPFQRKRGIGKKIMQAIKIFGKCKGSETLYLHVDSQNEAALGLYKQAGFQSVDDTYTMFKEFTESGGWASNHLLLYHDIGYTSRWHESF